MFDALFPESADLAQEARANRPPAPVPEPGVFKNVASGTGKYFMRSMAEAGRALSMAGAALPVASDLVHGGTKEQDAYFAAHDETFQRAVDHWTPKAGEVGVAGQVIGTVAGGITQFMASAPLFVGTAMLSTSEDLVRQGVDAGAALVAGDLAGLGAVAGIGIPAAIGKTLATKVASGVAGNVTLGAAQAGATEAVLKAADAPANVLERFDPLDVQARTVEALMGAAFGVAAHVGAPKFTPEQKDALLLLNQARHMETVSSPGKPATPLDMAASVRATREAIDQILTGKRVSVGDDVRFEPDPAKDAWRAEIEQVVRQDAIEVQPIARPDMAEAVFTPAEGGDAPARPQFSEEVRIPTGEYDTAGQPVYLSANEHVARADAELANAKATAHSLYMTAAECLLGAA